MVDRCANPKCGKPLQYLREGRMYIFAAGGGGHQSSRVEHYWLCGACSEKLILVQDALGVHPAAKAAAIFDRKEPGTRKISRVR